MTDRLDRSSEIDRELCSDSETYSSEDECSNSSFFTPPKGDSAPESECDDDNSFSLNFDSTYLVDTTGTQTDSYISENNDNHDLDLTRPEDLTDHSETSDPYVSTAYSNPSHHQAPIPGCSGLNNTTVALVDATIENDDYTSEGTTAENHTDTTGDNTVQDIASDSTHSRTVPHHIRGGQTPRGRTLQRTGAVFRGNHSVRLGRPLRRGGARQRGIAPRRNSRPPDDTWDKFSGLQKQFPFTRIPGFQVNLNNTKTPIDYFKLFLTDEVINLMVTETNRTAHQTISARRLSRRSRLRDWVPTTAAEMKKFLGLLLYMGLVSLPRISDYWSSSTLYKNSVAPQTMSRNRFQILLRFWHFNDNENPGENGRLAKVAPLLSLLNRLFKEIKIADEELTIDESMIPFRGRLLFRQYLPKKSHKYGVKLFKLCDKSAYTYHVKIYAGKGSNNTPEYLMGTSVVLELMEPFLNSGSTLYVDNYYNSVELAKILLEKNTHLVGTLRSDRLGIPRHLLFDHDLQKGEMTVAENKDGIVITRWLDKRYVMMLSTKHIVDMVVTGKKDRKGRYLTKPLVVEKYNGQKVGIDVADQLASYSTAVRKSLRWYKKVAEHLLFGTCIVNAMLAWKHEQNKICSVTSFKESVCLSLLDLGNDQPTPVVSQTGHHYLKESDVYVGLGKNKRRQRKVCKRCFQTATPDIRKH